MTDELLQERIGKVEQDWEYFLQIPLNPEVLAQAKMVAQTFSLRGADAIHLGSARYLKEKLEEDKEQVILVTSDQELKTAALASSIIVLDPTDESPPEIVPSDESKI